MVNKKSRKMKKPRKLSTTHRVKPHSSSVIDVRSQHDVKKALDIINKSKITLVLVYADWCPHCHTYKPFWQQLTKEKGNGVGMVAVEQTNSSSILNNINDDSTGKPINVEAFPQVIAVGKTPNGSNSGVTIENRNGDEIVNLVKNGSKVLNNSGSTSISTRTPTPYPSNELVKVNRPEMSNSKALSIGAKQLLSNMNAQKVNMGSITMSKRNENANSNQLNEIDEENIQNTVNESGVFQPPASETEVEANSSKKSSFIGGGRHKSYGGSLYESLVTFAGPVAPAAGLLAAQQTLFKSGRIGLLRSQKNRRKYIKKIIHRSRHSSRRSVGTKKTKRNRRN